MLTIIVLSLFSATLISESLAENPCTKYTNMNMNNGLRSSDFDSTYVDLTICDAAISEDTWYRLNDDSGTRLIETPVSPWRCGTQAPIWMSGTHPKTDQQTTATVCAVYNNSNCQWKDTIIIQMCNITGDSFFVYKLAVPPGCALAYCVDAASRKECLPPLVWIDDEFRCGENVTRTTRAPTTTPVFTTPTPPPDADGWGPWGPWFICSKPCDYGIQSRGRTCMNLPCSGVSISYQICNTYNCQELPEEKNKGIVLDVEAEASMDTMLKVVQNEQSINDILRSNINRICLQNGSLCCGQNVDSVSNSNIVFVTSSDIYSAQSFPRPNTDGRVYYKSIAVVNEDTDNTVCRSSSVSIFKRQADTTLNYISFDVMKIAAKNSEEEIYAKTDLNVKDIIDPSEIKNDYNSGSSSNLSHVVVIIIISVVVVVVVAAATAVILVCYCYFKNKSKGGPDPPPRYEPPSGPFLPSYETKFSPGIHDNSVHPTSISNQGDAIDDRSNAYDNIIYPPVSMSRNA